MIYFLKIQFYAVELVSLLSGRFLSILNSIFIDI